MRDGHYLLRTNLVAEDPAVLWDRYIQLTQIEADASRAYDEKNHRLWTAANQNIANLHDRLNNAVTNVPGKPQPPSEPDPAWALKDMCLTLIERLQAALEDHRKVLEPLPTFASKLEARCEEIADAIQKMRTSVDAVDDDEEPRRARDLLSRIMKNEKDLRRAIPRIEYDAE